MANFFQNLLNTGKEAITGSLGSGVTGLVGGLVSQIGYGKRLKQQIDAQKQLNEQAAALNYEYGEKAAENAFARQMQMYERSYADQSYSAMRKQMEDAGLSVGLMYGGGASGGAGGATSGAPQGATGGAEAGQAANAAQMAALGLQQQQIGLSLASQRAEIKLKEAQASEAEVRAEEAKANAGLITEQKITEMQKRQPMIESLNEDVKNKSVQRAIMGVDYRIKQIEFEIKEGTKNLEIEKLKTSVEAMKTDIQKGIEEIESLDLENQIKKATIQTQIEIYNAKLQNLIKDLIVKDYGINVSVEQANLFAEEARKVFTEREAIPTKMELEYEIAELMAKAGIRQTQMSSAGSLGSSMITALGLMSAGFLKIPIKK